MEIQKAAVSLHNTSLRLGGRDLWKKLSLDIAPGEFIAVLGPNGSGKSSFVKMLLGQHAPTQGTVEVLGKTPLAARAEVGYIPQQKAFDRDIPLTGRDLVGLGVTGSRWFINFTPATDTKKIEEAITKVSAGTFANKPLGQLSGGEQQRLRIAQATVNKPPLLLCDEPLLSLDLASQATIAKLIDSQRRQGSAVVFITHEINPILPYVDRVLYLVGGKWAIGTPSEVLTTEKLSNLYGTPVEVLNVHGRILVVASSENAMAEPHDAHHHHVIHSEADHE